MKKMTDIFFDVYFDECIVPYIRKNYKNLFPDIDKNLCLEHYNIIHKTNFIENDVDLNPTKCWVCEANKDRP